MSDKDEADVKKLCDLLLNVTRDIYINWPNLSDRSLTGADRLSLDSELDACLRQVTRLSKELKLLLN